MKRIETPGNKSLAFYEQSGHAGLPLVLLHGFCEDAAVWDGSMPFWQGLPVVRIDLPGFGKSDVPALPGMAAYAGAVLAALDHLNIDRCVLVGHSMGGYAALEFAAWHSKRLAGLGLFHSHPFEDTPERKDARRRGIEMLRSGKRDMYVTQLFPGLFPEAYGRAHPDVIEALINQGKRQPAEGIAAALEAMITRRNHLETLRAASWPVLFLLGELDAIVSPAQVWEAAVLPAIADIQVLPGVGHMGMFEATEKCAAIVREFWRFCNKF